MTIAERRARFRALHEHDGIFVMPNPWDVGSTRLLTSLGFEALATTSAGLAWSLGRNDQHVTRDELVAHVTELAAATPLPLSVDSERCFADDPAGVAETVTLLSDAGASGCSIEDYDPHTDSIDDVGRAAERVTAAAEAAHRGEPMVLTARAENHLHGVDNLDDTIARLVAYRDAGADAVYAPGLRDPAHIARVVEAVRVPVNVLALPGAPSVPELEQLGVRRVSTGSLLASAAYGALIAGARELHADGTSGYAAGGLKPDDRTLAFSLVSAERIRREVESWPGVATQPGNFGATAFVVGKREIGHLHGERTAHFAFPKRVAEELRAEGRIGPHPVFPDSVGMAARSIESEADVDDVIALLRLNYDRVVARHGTGV